MISVVVYGRNDGHGYNMHRRVALSLNCVAEILSDSDDEIVFVDYNTPDGLPTLPEAISDTLTDRCLSRLRVIRVPAAVHEQRFADHTHLPIVEPVARNCGVRRSSPANRWILSTTTDMVFTPHQGRSLSEVCESLVDGCYALPRFELPEWLWESLPRSDPRHTIAEVSRLGPSLALDEPTTSHEWIRFDAPGDFQLVLRDDLFAIDGFDERMLLGWHVDSNLSTRLQRLRGSIETLEEHLAGYHCNHSRTVTIYHGTELANDLDRFVYGLEEVHLPDQRGTWGLSDEELDEIDLPERSGPAFAAAVEAAVAGGTAPRMRFDARDAAFALEYDSAHVLPFVADEVRVSPRATTVGYMGANPVLRRMLEELARSVGLGSPLATADTSDAASIDEFERRVQLVIVDLGVDTSLVSGSLSSASVLDREVRTALVRVFEALGRLVERERTRLARSGRARRFVLVNSSSVYWNPYVLSQLLCSATTPHSRVRRAMVKSVSDTSEARAALARASQLLHWISRRDSDEYLRIRPSEHIRIASLDDYSGFGDGWSYPDLTGIWTQGPRSELSVALGGTTRRAAATLVLGFDSIGTPDDEPFVVDLLAEDELLGAYDFRGRGPVVGSVERRQGPAPLIPLHRRIARAVGLNQVRAARWIYLRALMASIRVSNFVAASTRRAPRSEVTWRVRLPARATTDGAIQLTLRVREPVRWRDQRQLGLFLTWLGLEAHQ